MSIIGFLYEGSGDQLSFPSTLLNVYKHRNTFKGSSTVIRLIQILLAMFNFKTFFQLFLCPVVNYKLTTPDIPFVECQVRWVGFQWVEMLFEL